MQACKVLSEPQARCPRPDFPAPGRGLDLLLSPFLPSREEKEGSKERKGRFKGEKGRLERRKGRLKRRKQTDTEKSPPNEKWPEYMTMYPAILIVAPSAALT